MAKMRFEGFSNSNPQVFLTAFLCCDPIHAKENSEGRRGVRGMYGGTGSGGDSGSTGGNGNVRCEGGE